MCDKAGPPPNPLLPRLVTNAKRCDVVDRSHTVPRESRGNEIIARLEHEIMSPGSRERVFGNGPLELG